MKHSDVQRGIEPVYQRMGAQTENGAAKSGTRRPASPQEQREGTHLGRFSVFPGWALTGPGPARAVLGWPAGACCGPSSQNMDSIPHLNCEVRLGCLGGGLGCLSQRGGA
jgi:hypothetical protein